MKNKIQDYQIISNFLAQKGEKRDIARMAAKLKNSNNNLAICRVLPRLFKSVPYMKKIIWGNVLPKTIEELGVGGNCYFFKPESLDNEINWILHELKPYKEQLLYFVQMRDEVERSILVGDYLTAEKYLNSSLKQLGYSVWYYEMKLTIFGYQDNLEKCISIVSDVNQSKKEDKIGFVTAILSSLFNRSQRKIAAYEYDSALYSRYKKNRTDFQNDRYNYYLFRLNYYQHFDIDDLSVTLIMEGLNSVVDRYILLLYVLRSYYIKEPKKIDTIIKFAKRLYKISSDKQLTPFLIMDSLESVPDSYFEFDFIEILDKYYTGRYREVVDLCKIYIQHNPSNFDIIKLYSRALLFLHNGYSPICSNTDAPINQMALYIFLSMTEKDNDSYLDRLYQLNKNLYGLRIAAGLDYFIKEEQNEKRSHILKLFSLIQFDPYFTNIYNDDFQKIEYLNYGESKISKSEVVEYQRRRIQKVITEESNVVAYIRNVDNAKITYDNADYVGAFEQWKNILAGNKGYIPTAQTAVEYGFLSLSQLGPDYRQKAVHFYVEQYIDNKAFVAKIDTRKFMKEIKQSRYEGLSNDIDFLIFIFLNAENYPQKEFVLQNYCKYEGVTYPSELTTVFKRKQPEKVEIFFLTLLTDDILFHYYKLKSTIEVLDEKLKIVTFLRTMFPQNRNYSDICTELMHELIAYRGMKKMDDSKIYVNEDAVLKYELNIDDLYERFKKQAVLVKSNRVYLVVSDFTTTEDSSSSDIIKHAVSYSDNAIAEVAIQLFDIIRYAFLKSRFGLGTYISTRIRHGIFEGELRSGLERLNLILNTENNSYVVTDYWRKEYSLDLKYNEILAKYLSKFSMEVDTLISSFKESVIQIKLKEEDLGEFNYIISTDEICSRLLDIESKTQSVDEFSLQVMAYLWEITEKKLEIIRDKIKNDLKPKFFEHLQHLESNIESLSEQNHLHRDLCEAIKNAREELTAKLVKVENWFYRQETKFEDFVLSDYIKMVLESTAKYVPDIDWELQGDLTSAQILIRSEFSASMFDLLSIIFSNMLEYSRKEPLHQFILHTAVIDNDIMHFHFENELPENANEDELNQLFEEKEQAINLLQKEGGSGLVKAMNIIKYDFNNIQNSFKIEATAGKCFIDILFNLKNMIKYAEDTIGGGL